MRGGWLARIRGLVGWGAASHAAAPIALPVEEAEAEALYVLSARPAHSPAELQRELQMDGDAFIATWEGSARLPAEARRRLIDLLAHEEDRVRALRKALENLG